MSESEKGSIRMIRGVIRGENGEKITSYGVSYRAGGKEYTVRDLSTHRSAVEVFVRRLRGDDNFSLLMDDLLEDFIS